MGKFAILVEDEAEQLYFTTQILTSNGFDVTTFETAAEALTAVESVPRPVDLVVLDRRLPQGPTDEPSDRVGDELLGALLQQLPDSPFVVFTGHTGIPHLQFAIQERGAINTGPAGQSLDRVCAFEKGQTIEFGDYVGRVAEQIDVLTDIEVTGFPASSVDGLIGRRLLRRVARHFGGVSISVSPLAGGLAEVPVWRCRVLNGAGHELASVVVKQSDGSKIAPAGGLHNILPASHVAAPVAVVSGLCDGKRAQVMQFAGAQPTSLLALLLENEGTAASQLGLIADAMATSLVGRAGTKTVAELAEPLSHWTDITERLASHSIAAPRGGLVASTQIAAQHGDLHPGNVLVVEGHPVLIDFDNEVLASLALDPVTALLAPLFHPDSPIRLSDWPSPAQCENLLAEMFLQDCPCPSWMSRAQDWVTRAATSERELWALVLAYAARQLKYEDVVSNEKILARAIALARTAASKLTDD